VVRHVPFLLIRVRRPFRNGRRITTETQSTQRGRHRRLLQRRSCSPRPLNNKGHNIHANACIIERIPVCPASPFRPFAPEWGG